MSPLNPVNPVLQLSSSQLLETFEGGEYVYTVYDAYLTNVLLGDLLTMVVLTAFLPILSFLFLPTTEGSTWNMEVE